MNKKLGFSFLFVILLVCTSLISCKSKNTTHSDNPSELLVQVFEDSSVSQLEDSYRMYKLKKERVVSRPMHIYLFTFNPESIPQAELIQLLKSSDLVKEAQTNKNVQSRN